MSMFKTLDATQISYRQRKRVKIRGKYALGRVLGEGSYGKVKEALHVETLDRVAVKIFSPTRLASVPGASNLVQREIALMRLLKHDNVVYALDEFVASDSLKQYVVMELVAGGTLQRLLEVHAPTLLPLHQTRHILKGVLKALAHLQTHRVVHRDIKPDNILLTVDGDAKLTDFGVALLNGERWDEVDAAQLGEGSLAYQPPECHEGAKTVRPGSRDNSEVAIEGAPTPPTPLRSSGSKKRKKKKPTWMRHPFKVDVWSLGVVLFVMVVGRFPFPNANLLALFQAIAEGAYTVPDSVDEELRALIEGMLCVEASERLNVDAIQEHAWLKAKLPKTKRLKCAVAESAFGESVEEARAILEAHMASESSRSESSRRGRSHSHDDEDSATPLSGSFGDDDDDNRREKSDRRQNDGDDDGDDGKSNSSESGDRDEAKSRSDDEEASKEKERNENKGAESDRTKRSKRKRCTIL